MSPRLLLTVGGLALLGTAWVLDGGGRATVHGTHTTTSNDSWPSAAAEIEAGLGLSDDYRREWIEGTLAWPSQLEELAVAILTGRADGKLSELELAEVDRIAAPYNATIEGISNTFLDLLDGELTRAFVEGRYEAVRVGPEGQANLSPPPETTLVSSTIGNRDWVVHLALDERDHPTLVQLKSEIHFAKDERGAAVSAYLGELAEARRPAGALSEAPTGSN
jgi:hypothetical protein